MNQPNEITVELWRIWIREYGAAGAIALALRYGCTRDAILRVNREARDLALRGTGFELQNTKDSSQ